MSFVVDQAIASALIEGVDIDTPEHRELLEMVVAGQLTADDAVAAVIAEHSGEQ